MSQEDTVDDDRLPFVARYREALAQTVSEEEFSAVAIQTIAEDWGKDSGEDRVQGVMFNLLETIEDAEYSNEVDFKLASDDVSIEGQALDEDPFEEGRPNRYLIKGMLGSGGMGQVFEVHDNCFDRQVAVKFLHPKAAAMPDKMKDFLKEAQLTARLEHPNIFPVHDVNISDGGMPYFSMRKANGESLKELLDECKSPHVIPDPLKSFNDRVSIIVKVCDAISYAHSQGLIHQDVKPSNIMIGDYGEVIVVDWGTARNLAEEDGDGKAKLQGTPIYMSPEQARREFSTILSDVFCIGATLFHMLTFRFPIWSDDPDTFWDIKKQGILPEISEEEMRTVPGPLLSISLKAMAADPKDRYQSVLEMRMDLVNYQRGLKVLAHKDRIADVVKRAYRLNKRAVWAACAFCIALLALVSVIYQEVMKSQSEWRVVYEFNFDTDTMDDVEKNWNAYRFYKFSEQKVYPIALEESSPFVLKEGALHINARASGSTNYNLSFGHHISGDIRVEWDYTALVDGASVNCFIGAPNRFDAYMFHMGGNGADGATYKYLTKQEQFVDQVNSNIFVPGQVYRMRLEKEGEYVRLFIDDEKNIEFRDIDILQGPGHQTFGFEALHNHLRIDNVRISSRPLPEKISPIMVANSLVSNQRYAEAIEHYQDIARAYTGTELDALATYRRGRCHAYMDNLEQALVAFNDFRFRFPDHELMGYALRDTGLIYCRKGQWKQAAKYFEEIAASFQDASLRRSTYQAIEMLSIDHISPDVLHRVPREDALALAREVMHNIRHWRDRLGVEVAVYNSITGILASAFLVNGDFDTVLKEFDYNKWHWAVMSVYQLTGKYADGAEHFLNVNKHTDAAIQMLIRSRQFDRLMELNPRRTDTLISYYLHKGDTEKVEELLVSGGTYARAAHNLRSARYDLVLSNHDNQSLVYLRALWGLGRFSDVTFEKFKNLDEYVYTCWILDGRAADVLEKADPYQYAYTRALASLALDASVREDDEAYLKCKQELGAIRLPFETYIIQNAAFEKYLLIPFLDALQSSEPALLKTAYNEFLADPVYSQLRLPSVAMRAVLGQELSEEDALIFQVSEMNLDLCFGMKADIGGDSATALTHYESSLGSIPLHYRSIVARFLESRISALRSAGN